MGGDGTMQLSRRLKSLVLDTNFPAATDRKLRVTLPTSGELPPPWRATIPTKIIKFSLAAPLVPNPDFSDREHRNCTDSWFGLQCQ